jgi:hypothetical protein
MAATAKIAIFFILIKILVVLFIGCKVKAVFHARQENAVLLVYIVATMTYICDNS